MKTHLTPTNRTLDIVASVSYQNGELLAVVRIDEESARALLVRAEAFRAAKNFVPRLHRMAEFHHAPKWIEDDGHSLGDAPAAIRDDLFWWAGDEDLETERDWKTPPSGFALVDESNISTEDDMLVVEAACADERPGMVDFYWTARVKHTDADYLETPKLAEEAIRAWLAKT